MDSETLTGDKEGFLLLKPCSVALGGTHRSTALRPSLDGLPEAEGLCGPLSPEPRMSPCGTAEVLFLWARRAFPYNREAVL